MKQRQSLMVLTILLTVPATVLGYWYYSSFNKPVLYPLPSEPMDIAVQDVNGDGHSDIVVASRSGRALTIFTGDGTGALRPHSEIMLALAATSLVIEDLNQDGAPDLAVTVCNEDCTHSGVLIFTGAGNGNFDEPVDFALSGTPTHIYAADFNHDGRADLVTTNLAISQVTFLMSKGAGEFAEWGLDTDEPPVSIAVQDYNNDGKPDLVAINKKRRSVSLFTNSGDTDIPFSRRDIPIGATPTDVEFKDFNRDGKMDLAVTHATRPGKLSIFWGAGNGYFRKKNLVETESLPVAVQGDDFNGDGFNDLLVMRKHKTYAILHLNDGKGHFQKEPFRVQMGRTISTVALAKINDDSVPDIVALSYSHPSLSVAMGVGKQ